VSEILRAVPSCVVREAAREGPPLLTGRFAVFNRWTEIDSFIEGHFMERVAPGAFLPTFVRDRARMKVLFEHGLDPQIGRKVLGPIETLREDALGAYYEVPLFDTAYNAELLPGLRAGSYGASFRGEPVRFDVDHFPKRSEYNPERLPEHTLREVELIDFGPVTFPAYEGATAGVRSLTDWYVSKKKAA